MKFRDSLDLVNSIQLLETLGGDVESYTKIKQEVAIYNGIPTFLSAFMPKSGGTYLHNNLCRIGAVEIFHGTQNPINHYQSYLIESWLRVFLKGGAACHTHMAPTPYNLGVLRRSGAKRLWVHARDPRQSALSSYWHMRGVGQGRGDQGEARLKALDDVTPKMASVERAMGLIPVQEDTFEEQIKFFFLLSYQWASDWAQVKSSSEDIEILLTTFEQLVTDRQRFEGAVTTFFDYRDAPSRIFGDVSDNDRFRNGSLAEWKGAYSPDLCLWLRSRIDPVVYDMFGWNV